MNKTVYGHVDFLTNDKTVKSILVILVENYKAIDMYDIVDDIVDELDGQNIYFNKCKVQVENINTCYTEMDFSETFLIGIPLSETENTQDTIRDVAEHLEDFAHRLVQYTDRIERFIEKEADDYGLTIEY